VALQIITRRAAHYFSSWAAHTHALDGAGNLLGFGARAHKPPALSVLHGLFERFKMRTDGLLNNCWADSRYEHHLQRQSYRNH
jgi:hypothetical protein